MLRIGDFSKLSRISIRMLRHYDEIGILQPERYVASVRQVILSYDQEGLLWEIMCRELEGQNVQQAVLCYGIAVFHDEGHKEHDPDVEIQSAVVGTYEDTEHVKFKTVPPIMPHGVCREGFHIPALDSP